MKDSMFETAFKIALRAHEGQFRRDGDPYIGHPIRVATFFPLEMEAHRVVGLLHDTVEDTEITLEDLSRVFPSYIVRAVDAISRREEESYFDYIDRCCENDLAREVKVSDVFDNLPTCKPTMIERYEKTLQIISSLLSPEVGEAVFDFCREVAENRMKRGLKPGDKVGDKPSTKTNQTEELST